MTHGYVYILTNDRQTVLYTGCTEDLKKRLIHHRRRLIPGFTKKYNVHQLVYFEKLESIEVARLRERQIKNMSRAKKEALIKSINESWKDLLENRADESD